MNILSIAILTGLMLVAVPALAGDLVEGSPAPPIKVAKWVKGTPVATFQPGKVYVVEFWATWCGPCIESIPHLTELAHKYKDKVTVIGVNVWDKDTDPASTAYQDRVEKWAQAKKDMDYNVCVDGVDMTMANTWMKAAGQQGIPASFVIDQKGVIAWIGHPMDGLGEVLAKVVTGSFDAETARKMREEQKAKQKEIADGFTAANELIKAGKVDEGFAKIDTLVELDPSLKSYLPVFKFTTLAQYDERKAMALAHEYVFIKYDGDREVLEAIGTSVCMNYVGLKNPDYDLGIKALQAVMNLDGKESASIVYGIANATYSLGKKVEAVKLMERGLNLIAQDPTANPRLKDAMDKKLADFKAGK